MTSLVRSCPSSPLVVLPCCYCWLQLGPTDIDESSAILLEALVLRMDYMARSCQPFCTTTAHALSASKRGPSPAAGNGRGRAPSASSSE